MEMLFAAIFSWQFILFSLAIAAIVFVVRKFIEFFYLDNPKVSATRESLFWKTVILPILPIVLGFLLAIIFKMFPFPVGILSYSARASWGLVAGMFSGILWQVALKTLMDKFLPEGSRFSSLPQQDKQTDIEIKELTEKVSQTINKE